MDDDECEECGQPFVEAEESDSPNAYYAEGRHRDCYDEYRIRLRFEGGIEY